MKCQEIQFCCGKKNFKLNDEGIKIFQDTIVVGNKINGIQKSILLDQAEKPDIQNGRMSSARIKTIKPCKNQKHKKKKKYYTFAKNGRLDLGGKRNNKVLLKINTFTSFDGKVDGKVSLVYGNPEMLKKGYGTDKNKTRWYEYLCILTPSDVLLLSPLGYPQINKYVIYFSHGHLVISDADKYAGKYQQAILDDNSEKFIKFL